MENCRWCIYRCGLDQAEGTSISKELLIIDPILQVLSPHIKIGKWMYIYVLNLNKMFKVRMYDILISYFSFNSFFFLPVIFGYDCLGYGSFCFSKCSDFCFLNE